MSGTNESAEQNPRDSFEAIQRQLTNEAAEQNPRDSFETIQLHFEDEFNINPNESFASTKPSFPSEDIAEARVEQLSSGKEGMGDIPKAPVEASKAPVEQLPADKEGGLAGRFPGIKANLTLYAQSQANIKRSGKALTESLMVARSEQQNNTNDLESATRKVASAVASSRGASMIPLFTKLTGQQNPKPVEGSSKELSAAIAALKISIQSQENVLTDLGNRYAQHVTDHQTLVDETKKQNEELAFQNSQLQELESRREAKLKSELEESNRRVDELQATQIVVSHTLTSSSSKVSASTQTDNIVDDKAELITSLKSANAALRYEVDNMKEQLEQEFNAKAQQVAEDHSAEILELRDNFKIDKLDSDSQLEELKAQIKKLKLELVESKGNFRSWLRLRPAQGNLEIQNIEIHGENTVKVVDRFNKSREFTFDRVFDPQADNPTVFQDLSEILEAALQGYNITVLAYGQTGSGKTYTMTAMLNMALEKLFTDLTNSGEDFTINGRCIEIYEGKLYDLLKSGRDQPKVSMDCSGLWPSNDQQLPVETAALDTFDSVLKMVKTADKNRTSGSTAKNETSSRSHMFLSFRVKVTKPEPSGAITTTQSNVTFVDLAGSESLKNVIGRETETKAINSELSALKSVLNAMGPKASSSVIPFRDTQLTRLFRDGFTGGKVLFIQAASMGELEESLHTMNFGELVSAAVQKKPSKDVVTKFPGAPGEVATPTQSAASTSTRNTARGGSRGGAPARGSSTSRGRPPTRGSSRDAAGRGK